MSRKCTPFTREWHKRATELALAYAPEIQACVECNEPVIAGFCCLFCNSSKGSVSEEYYDPRVNRT